MRVVADQSDARLGLLAAALIFFFTACLLLSSIFSFEFPMWAKLACFVLVISGATVWVLVAFLRRVVRGLASVCFLV